MRKGSKEYTPQFDIDNAADQPAELQICMGCEKICESINEEGFCFECEQRLKKQQSHVKPIDRYSLLIQEHNAHSVGNIEEINRRIKNFYGSYFKMKIFLNLLPSFLIMIFILLAIILKQDLFIGCCIPISMWAVISICYIFSVYENTKMLERTGLSNMVGANKPNGERVFFDENGIIITENFVYCFKQRIILPIKHIQIIEINRPSKFPSSVFLYYNALLVSGKHFMFMRQNTRHLNEKFTERFLRQLKKINPTIEVEQ